MSDTRAVMMKLVIDATSVQRARAEVDKTAASVKKLGQEAKQASAAVGGGPGAATAGQTAFRNDRDSRRAVVSQLANGGGGGAAGGAGGIPGPFKALLGVGAANAAARAFGNSFLDRSRDPDRFTPSGLATDTLRGLPLVGGFVGGATDLFGGGLGLEDVRGRQRTGLGIEAVNRGSGLSDQLRQIRSGGAGALDARRAANIGATSDYNAARAFSTELGRMPNLDKFTTENRLGVSNEATGQLRLASLQSQERANASANTLGGEEDILRKRQKEQADAQARVEEARQRQAKAESEADAANQAQKNKGFGYDPTQYSKNTKIDATAEEKQIAAAQARKSTEEALAAAKEKQLATDRQAATVDGLRLKSAQDAITAAKALIAERQNELGLLKEQEGAQKSQARAIAGMSEQEKDDLKTAAQKLKQGGVGALGEDEIGLLSRTSPQLADIIGRQQEAIGAKDQTNQQINDLFGLSGLDTVKEQIKTQSAELIEANRRVNEESAKAIKDVMEQGLKDFTAQLAAAIKTAFDSASQAADKQTKDGKFLAAQG